MFRYILALIILVSPTARAETQHPISEALASGGIVAALAELEGKDDPESLFLQGSLSFLRGIEITMQMRWQHGASMAGTDIPVLRLPVAPNPDAAPFYPGLIRDIFDITALEMERARGFLAQIPADADFGVTINITEIWFDVNSDGMPQAEEFMPNIASAALDQRMNETAAPVLIRFDRADAYWLSAYTHVLSGLSEMAAAFDPTAAITQVIEARDAMNALGPNPYNMGAMMIAMILTIGWIISPWFTNRCANRLTRFIRRQPMRIFWRWWRITGHFGQQWHWKVTMRRSGFRIKTKSPALGCRCRLKLAKLGWACLPILKQC